MSRGEDAEISHLPPLCQGFKPRAFCQPSIVEQLIKFNMSCALQKLVVSISGGFEIFFGGGGDCGV